MGIFSILQKDPFADLEKSIKGMGHPEYPFLHPTYCPMSRIPCTDFSFWVKERLRKKDYKSIEKLFFKIIEANPGISVSLGDRGNSALLNHWSQKLQKIYRLNLKEMVNFNNAEAYLDLRSLLILDLPHSDKERLTYFAYCMAPYIPRDILCNQSSIILSTNRVLGDLPLSSRSHFVDICNLYKLKNMRSMPCEKSSYYSTRQRGISLQSSAEKLASLQLICFDKSEANAMKQYTKEDLVEFGRSRGILVSLSWKKEKIIASISEQDPISAKVLSERYQLIYPSQTSLQYYDEFLKLLPAIQRTYTRFIPLVV